MTEIIRIDEAHEEALALKNDPFPLWGKMILSYSNGRWDYSIEKWPEEAISEMCFPDEQYALSDRNCVYFGAYEDGRCVGLVVLKKHFLKYMYIEDLKVCAPFRRRGIARLLIDACLREAKEQGYRGVYLAAQDNNLSACLFYLSAGFRIGGLDTESYTGTSQEGKKDIFFYLDA